MDGKLKMTRNDTVLLVVTGSVASNFENLSGKVIEDADTLGVVALLEETVDTTDWELEPSFCRARYGFVEGK